MLIRSAWLKLLIAVLLCVAPSWAKPNPVEKVLQGVEARRARLFHLCLQNFENQFTPGYKANICSFDYGADLRNPDIDLRQGEIFKTQNSVDLAIDGVGFFVLQDGLCTRDGRFTWHDGQLVSETQRALQAFPVDRQGNIDGDLQAVTLPLDPQTKLYAGLYKAFHFGETGALYGEQEQQDPVTGQKVTSFTPLFRVPLANFSNPHRLTRVGTTLFRAHRESGEAWLGLAGQGILGRVVGGALELANVDFMEQGYVLGVLDRGRLRFLPAQERKSYRR